MTENVNHYQIHWFPGHMMKTLRLMQAEMKNVDAVIHLLDARIPKSSVNPEILNIVDNKNIIYVLNKADLADKEITAQWIKSLKASGAQCVAISSKTKNGPKIVKEAVELSLKDLIEKRNEKGMANAKIRVMVVGIPNVGKSTFINSFAGQTKAKAADKPGVTRGKQWISVGNYDLLDMPGVLWKKFENNATAVNLAFIGSIKDDILDVETLACGLLDEIKKIYPEKLLERYKLTQEDLKLDGYDLLCAIGKKRGMLQSGGVVNTLRAATMLNDEFRATKLGCITLEVPQE